MPTEKLPTSHQTHPPDLATIDALKREGLQPAQGQTVAVLFKRQTGDREHLSGLYRRAEDERTNLNLPAGELEGHSNPSRGVSGD
ncbi:hypothetical protein E7T06_09850 [Deinococcus sp. Arct2-2]|uniref:hypothetical protein n=1 Tax=Deinococcus sp. Arct2-2 TaxID=2568653 RepID=UPI0010A3785F|nr:hypothetical protein [Deinococcus sp. Arct2-2]THF69899.1 hypothetical protein E7T06_09705 [Deinococcus sp. Arct2-2]THF69917.1 hypothetical protein E7T06_09850 [Deinococcus sp. Arct2-2]